MLGGGIARQGVQIQIIGDQPKSDIHGLISRFARIRNDRNDVRQRYEPVKIIIGTESFAPNISGVAVVTELLAKSLARVGHEVHVFAPSRSYRTYTDFTLGSFPVLRLRSFQNPFRKEFRIALLPRRQITRAIRNIRPDIMHLQDPGSVCSAMRKVGNRSNIPVIVSNHFTLEYVLSYMRCLAPLHPIMRSMLLRYLVRFYNRCDYVLCPTETVKHELESWGVSTPIKEVSNGVDLERFYSYSSPSAVRAKYQLNADPVVLYVGRMDKDKDLQVLIRAIPHVLRSAAAHFIFVGNGDRSQKLKTLAQRLKVAHKISFLGWINHESPDLPEIYQVASVFAIPSSVEAQSIVTLEAMASGLPVVAANGGALPELVRHGENGLLFPPGDSECLAERIVAVLRDRDLYAQMRKRSLEIVSQHRIAESYNKIESIYEEVLRQSSP